MRKVLGDVVAVLEARGSAKSCAVIASLQSTCSSPKNDHGVGFLVVPPCAQAPSLSTCNLLSHPAPELGQIELRDRISGGIAWR